jgi:hypothetical protein
MFESDKEYIFTEDELIKLCQEWQERLRLEHWEIALRIARVKDFTLKDCSGECNWTQSIAQATIRILDPLDYPCSPFKQDMECILVHELLHLHFCPFDETKDQSLENIMLERAIEHIAKALVKLKRETITQN